MRSMTDVGSPGPGNFVRRLGGGRRDPHPTRFAGHLLPQGEKDAELSRVGRRLRRLQLFLMGAHAGGDQFGGFAGVAPALHRH